MLPGKVTLTAGSQRRRFLWEAPLVEESASGQASGFERSNDGAACSSAGAADAVVPPGAGEVSVALSSGRCVGGRNEINRSAWGWRAFRSSVPFIGWYPDPTSGLHGELAIGLALGAIGDFEEYGEFEYRVSDYEGAGWGVVLGGGYDFWVGEQWSLGLFGRVSYARLGMSEGTNTLIAWSPAFGASATFH